MLRSTSGHERGGPRVLSAQFTARMASAAALVSASKRASTRRMPGAVGGAWVATGRVLCDSRVRVKRLWCHILRPFSGPRVVNRPRAARCRPGQTSRSAPRTCRRCAASGSVRSLRRSSKTSGRRGHIHSSCHREHGPLRHLEVRADSGSIGGMMTTDRRPVSKANHNITQTNPPR